MKAIILNAGMGTRLGQTFPKCLTLLTSQQTLLSFQLYALQKHLPLENITIVVGHQNEKIADVVNGPLLVNNPNYASTNTAKSLLLALDHIDDDFILLNGDVFFESEILAKCFKTKDSASIVLKGPVNDEEVRYRTNAAGFIIELSKQVKSAEGESVGMHKINRSCLADLRCALIQAENQDFYEKGLESMIRKGQLLLKPIEAAPYFVKEIDFPHDLADVRRYLSKKSGMVA